MKMPVAFVGHGLLMNAIEEREVESLAASGRSGSGPLAEAHPT